MAYQNKTTGEIISDEDFQTRFGDQVQAPEISQPSGGSNFLQRLKLGFGGSEAKAEQQRLEEQAGLKGKFDVGDIADLAGAALPLAGGVIGGIVGTPFAGSAIGAAAGQGARRLIGGLIGADQPTGGELAKDVAITGVGTYAGGRILGPLFTAFTKVIPQKFISTIFKQSADDIAAGIKSSGKNLTQSEEILQEGFRGSPEKMMTKAWETMKSLEAQTKVAVSGQAVKITNKQGYIDLITDFLKNLKKVSFGFEPQIVKDGNTIIQGLKSSKGDVISGEIALATRRFIDSVRRTSSFKFNQNLAPKEAAYKKAADTLRGFLSKQIEGLAPILKKYSIHINAFDDLANYAAKTQNKDLFDLIDVFIMYGIDPSAYLGRRFLTSASFKTNVAQGLYKIGQQAEKFVPQGLIPTTVTQGARRLFGNQSESE